MVERHYDAHLYFANWGSRTLMFRLPLAVLDVETAAPYLVDLLVSAWDTAEHLVLGLHSDDEDAEFFGVDDLYTVAALVGPGPSSRPVICARSISVGWRPRARGAATRARSTRTMRRTVSHRCRRGCRS